MNQIPCLNGGILPPTSLKKAQKKCNKILHEIYLEDCERVALAWKKSILI